MQCRRRAALPAILRQPWLSCAAAAAVFQTAGGHKHAMLLPMQHFLHTPRGLHSCATVERTCAVQALVVGNGLCSR